jgi:hypothetical protein
MHIITKSSTNPKGNGSSKPTNKSSEANSSLDNSDCSREQMIAEAAFYYAERRGFLPDNEITDWLQAESDIDGLMQHGSR